MSCAAFDNGRGRDWNGGYDAGQNDGLLTVDYWLAFRRFTSPYEKSYG